ncbi:hypothetical protein EUTSA_v10011931mg [Eutrema salsugineum]|uniref:Uncharacterized protein n=1 Tax=Eutrema salsugineum TaxID=72664 RepID=V4KFD9_EUTSA|nr:hypothetical protein EUTSA_v10011931mg [Eutrema salsugineum]
MAFPIDYIIYIKIIKVISQNCNPKPAPKEGASNVNWDNFQFGLIQTLTPES